MKAIDKLREITTSLKNRGFGSAGKEAEILVSRCFDFTLLDIYKDNPDIDENRLETVEQMLERRLRHEPLQYIFGFEEFLGLKLSIGPGVLIPRPETELMAGKAIEAVKRETLNVNRNTEKTESLNSQFSIHNSPFTVLDMCTGSGCLALAIAKEFPESRVIGSDISEAAIKYAKKNAEINNINNAAFLTGDLFEPIGKQLVFDVIISNPPYIKSKDIHTLQPEIKDWEPVAALDGGEDGLEFYRKLIPQAKGFLKQNGLLMLELGIGQAESAAAIMESSGYADIQTIKDYAGVQRIIQAKWKK